MSKIRGAKLTIRRPDGTVEIVIHTDLADWAGVIHAPTFAKMRAATRAAGRGEILSQEPNVLQQTPEEILAERRAELVWRLQDSAGAFPGSRQWHDGRAAEAELGAFDDAHPEIVAAVKAARAARTAEGAGRMARGED